MQKLRSFFMEDWLESNRFHAKYNLGESGGRARTVSELLSQSGLSQQEANEIFLGTKLCDSPNRGRNDLREIIAKFHEGADLENILITTGSSEALFLLFRYLNPKSVALALPAFQLLYELPQALQAKVIALPVRWNNLGVPFIDEEEWIYILESKKPECILINHPHNPSGLILSQKFLNRIQDIAQKINATIIGDEHYRFLSDPKKALGNTIYRNNDRTFITGSFIKCFGCPGLRIGWCIGSKKALNLIQNEKNYTTHTVSPITEWISYEVLKNTESELFKNIKKEWLENKELLDHLLKQSTIFYGVSPEGGLVSSLGLKNLSHSLEYEGVFNQLLKNGVFTLPLQSMEFGSFNFQKATNYKEIELSKINLGFGVRFGIGIEPHKLKELILTDLV